MMHVKEKSKILLAAAVMVVSGFVMTVVAQETQPQKPAATRKTYGGGRDPFRKYEPPRPMSKLMDQQSPIPSIHERISQYKAQKAAAMNARMTAPKPTT